jgi:hypothetical protein
MVSPRFTSVRRTSVAIAIGAFLLVALGESTESSVFAERADSVRPLSSLWFDASIPASQQAVTEDARLSEAILAALEPSSTNQ